MDESTFLDVDDSIQTTNLLLPDKDRDALNQQMDELMKQFDSKPSIIVQPIPGICVKTKRNSGEKVFLNICISDKVPPPEDISDTKLFELINEEVPTYTIPMSIGSEKMDTDKAGAPCIVHDVIINSTYFKKCQEKKHFMQFTILIIIYGIADKSGKELNVEDYVILKNRTVMGKLHQHRIENRELQKSQGPKTLIEEISHSSKITEDKLSPQNYNETKLGYVILKEPLNSPANHLIVLFNMTKSISIEDIIVLINSDRINVTDEKACYSHDILVPYILKINDTKATFDYSIKVLRLDIPIEQN